MAALRTRKSRVILIGATALVAAVVVAGCSSGSQGGSAGAGGGSAALAPNGAAGSEQRAATGAVPAPASGFDASGSKASAPIAADTGVDALTGRSVVRTASLTVRVKTVLTASSAVTRAAMAQGGFVAGEQTTADPAHPDQARADITVRVPSSRLPALLSQLHTMGDLLAEQQAATDVTGQVIDVQARLATQQASVTRVRALLARATTLGQVVQIEGELSKREAALESLQAQSKQLADQTSLATVTVSLVGPAAVTAVAEPAPTGFGSGLSKGWHAFVTASTWLLTAIGALLPFLVLLALVGIPVWLVVRRRRRLAPEPPAPAAA